MLFAQAAVEKPALELGVRIPLSIMNFLEFAIWGAWFVVLGNYLNSLHFSRPAIGRIYATMALGTVISPMFVGTIADKYFASEQLMGVLHLVGAALLYCMAIVRTPRLFYWVALAYALVYAPTLALVNSVGFSHMPDAERDFPLIRVFGTIGWIAAGLSLRLLIRPGEFVNNRPLILASILSATLGIYSFFLPHTPPSGTAGIPFLDAFNLLTDFSFAVFFGVSFFITLALAFYYSWTALFLENSAGVKPENVGPLMTVGQWVEIFFMFTLTWFLKELGMRGVLIIGMAAWGVRYAIFASRAPLPILLIGVALHGICFDFFFAAGFIHVDQTAPAAIKNSGQSLFAVLTYGLGMWLGTEASGWLNQWCTTDETDPQTGATFKKTDWTKFWLIPCVGVLIALVAFVALF
jgi:nucleoside transporter